MAGTGNRFDSHPAVAADAQKTYRLRFNERQCRQKSGIWDVLVKGFFQKWVRPEDSVLDLGCGYGEFINRIRCSRRIGVDLNPDSAQRAEDGVEFHQTSVCEFPFLADSTIDVVFISNLMEHLPDKSHVRRMLNEVRRVLKPGGHVIAMGPNIRFVHGAYWDFWDHVVPITDRSLAELLRTLGFGIANHYPKFLPYTTCRPIPQHPWLVRLYLALPILWRIAGRQFLLRAQKQA